MGETHLWQESLCVYCPLDLWPSVKDRETEAGKCRHIYIHDPFICQMCMSAWKEKFSIQEANFSSDLIPWPKIINSWDHFLFPIMTMLLFPLDLSCFIHWNMNWVTVLGHIRINVSKKIGEASPMNGNKQANKPPKQTNEHMNKWTHHTHILNTNKKTSKSKKGKICQM